MNDITEAAPGIPTGPFRSHEQARQHELAQQQQQVEDPPAIPGNPPPEDYMPGHQAGHAA